MSNLFQITEIGDIWVLTEKQNSSRCGSLDYLSHPFSPALTINSSLALSISQSLYSQLNLMRGRRLESSRATDWLSVIRGRNGILFVC